jgi:branched-chain amino acid aminotransferase
MEILTRISTRKTTISRVSEVDFENLEFGKYVSDHMLVCDYSDGGWKQPQIVPYSNLSMSPSTLALHYGQTVFEGMKAFRMKNGSVSIFRLERHYERFVKSLERMCMAVVPREVFIEGLIQLVQLDFDWVPGRPGHALYIRPFVFASESKFGVKVSEEYRFIIFTGPVPAVYEKPIRVKVETNYVRAARGGTGNAKCGGNYGAAFLPTHEARKQGYEQVLWTDPIYNKYIEESGMMNVAFVINNRLVTPALSDSILEGITRESFLVLAKDLGIRTEERLISIDELQAAFWDNTISEAFGIGTAAVVAPIETIHIDGIDFQLPINKPGSISSRLKDTLAGIRSGRDADVYGWNFVVRK